MPRPHSAEPRRPGVAGFFLSVIAGAAIIAFSPWAEAQNTGANRSIEPRHLIDVPTAGMLRGGMTSFQADFFHEDGLTAAFAYGIFDRLMVGISYGALHLIGTEPQRGLSGIQSGMPAADNHHFSFQTLKVSQMYLA